MEASQTPFLYERKDGYDDAHLSHLLAEDLPADYAYNRLRKLSTQRSAYGWYRSAFAHIEFALCRSAPLDDQGRANLLYECNQILARPMGLDSHPTTDALRLSAATVCSYIPVFKKRALGLDITQEDCTDLYKSLAVALTMSQAFASEPSRLDSRLAEGLVLALSVRTGQPEHMIWPASPREEATDDQPSNHDGYSIVDQYTKMRVQTKLINSDKRYNNPMIIMVVDEILTHISRKRAKRHQLPVTEISITELIDIIFRESNGAEISAYEKFQLDVATARLVRPLAEHQKTA